MRSGTLVRVDHTVSDKNRLYGRYTATPIVKIQGTPVSPTNNGAYYSWGKQAMLADTHTFSPTVLNDLRLNYTRGVFSNTVAPQWDPRTGQNLNTLFGLPSITAGGLPSFSGLFPGSPTAMAAAPPRDLAAPPRRRWTTARSVTPSPTSSTRRSGR